MKKLVGALVLVFALTSCTQVKIAHADVEEILKEYEGSKKAEEEMKAQLNEWPMNWISLRFRFNKKYRSISRILKTFRQVRDRNRNSN